MSPYYEPDEATLENASRYLRKSIEAITEEDLCEYYDYLEWKEEDRQVELLREAR